MNRIYRLIWSAVRQCWIVAAEKVTAKGGIPARTVGALSVAVLLACGTAHALPTDGTVAAGSATIGSPTAGQMQITQTSNRAVINWQSFGIASGEAVNITQPSAQAALLNRVVGNSSSEIYGSLSANGQVFLINPNGVLFGKGASVNVGGLVASSLNITDDNFMNNNLKFFKDGTAGSVSNQGSITAGFAALLGPTVDNCGSIVTYKGSTALGAANAVTLNFDTSGLIALTLTEGAYNAQVSNSGIIEADGGRVLLTAKSADSILKSMVNTSGIIRARSVDTSSGQILLLGDMDNGTVSVGGTLDASAPTGGNGGFIETSAAHVTVGDTTRVTTLAANGNNGTWLIDPDGFTIAASGGDMTGAAVQTALAGGNLSIASTSGSGSNGNINVNDTVSWSANKLTLTATNDINVNAVMTASGTSSLDLEPGSGKVNMGLNSSGFSGRVDFPGRSGTGFLTIGGLGYTVLSNQVGTPGSITSTDLQGMSINAAALTGHYALGSNIDASATSSWPSGAGFQPVGNITNNFTGSFDGLGHTISNLYINRGSTDYVGLFGYSSGTLRNVGLVGGSITGRNRVGGLAGLNSGNISNAYATGSVSGDLVVGGLVGYNYTGGRITSSHATGNVSGTTDVGGLVGWNFSSLFILTSYATGDVSGTTMVGGLVGKNEGNTHVSYATGDVSGTTDVGGLVGKNEGNIGESYATGTVSGTDAVGGVAGNNQFHINHSYATGAVTGGGGSTSVGGLAGSNGASATISDSFFNTETTHQTSAVGDNVGTLTNAIGKTTTEMKTAGTFSAWGTYISSTGGSSATWRIYDGYTYPLLRSFLTSLTLTPAYDGSGTALTNIGTVTATTSYDSSKVLGSLGSTLTLSGSSAGSYIASVRGLYSTQQGYDISYADRTITTTGSAAGDIVITNPITWSSGTLAINTSGTISATAAISGTGSAIFNLQSGTWSQIDSSPPAFSVYDFRLSGGSFIRALSGNGSSSSPYALADIYGVQGIGSSGMLGKSYLLANDIDASGTSSWNSGSGFKPIGNYTTGFTGSFDGQSHTIDGLTINRGSESYVGLFGANFGTISHLALTDVSVTGGMCSGGLAGYNYGSIANISVQGSVVATDDYAGLLTGGNDDGSTISNVTASGSASGVSNVGGLVGFNWGSLSNASASVTVTGSGWYFGGLAGENGGSISNSHATGNVSGSGDYVGGLVGTNNLGTASDAGQITDVYATGAVSGVNYVGGLVGANDTDGYISNAYATGSVAGTTEVGGLVGRNFSGTISTSHATGSVTAGDNSESVGGLVGFNDGGAISTSYATGAVASGNNSEFVGGLVGMSSGNGSTISISYATGSVTSGSGSSSVGGLAGYNGQHGYITSIYATGAVTAGSSSTAVGGLAGENAGTIANSYTTGLVTGGSGSTAVAGLLGNNSGTVSLSFFNTDTSGQSSAVGDNTGTLTNVTGKTTAQMKSASTFSSAGWDISSSGGSTATWRIYDGYTTPLLRAFLTSLAITANSDSKTYDGNAYSGGNGVTCSVVGAEASPNLLGTLAYGGSSQGATNASTYAITPGGLHSNQQGYDISYVNGTLTINPAVLTAITGNLTGSISKVYDGTNAAILTSSNYLLTGWVGSDGATVTKTTGSYDNANAGSNKTVTVTLASGDYSATGSTNLANYSLPTTISGAVGSISKAPLTVTGATAQNKVYDSTTAATISGATLSGIIGTDIVTVSGGGSFADKNVANNIGVTAALTLGGAAAGNYSITQPVGLSAAITPAPLAIAANNASKTYDGAAYSGGNGVSYSGLVGGETAAVLSGTLAYSGSSQGATDAGSYVITPGGLSSGNYAISYLNGLLTINPAPLVITGLGIGADNKSKVYGDPDPALTYTLQTGTLASGDQLSGSLTRDTGENAGSYAIRQGTLSAGSNYTISFSNGTLTITPAPLTITASNASKISGQTYFAIGTEFTASGLKNSEQVGSVTLSSAGAPASAAVGSYAITPSNASGGSFTPANYSITYQNGTLTVTAAANSHTGIVNPATGKTVPDMSDAYALLQYLLGKQTLTAAQIIAADVGPLGANGQPQGDGVLDFGDLITMLRRINGAVVW